ncbi:hypothetical protein PAMP_001082 [Pampus punctatissimus]
METSRSVTAGAWEVRPGAAGGHTGDRARPHGWKAACASAVTLVRSGHTMEVSATTAWMQDRTTVPLLSGSSVCWLNHPHKPKEHTEDTTIITQYVAAGYRPYLQEQDQQARRQQLEQKPKTTYSKTRKTNPGLSKTHF